MADKRAPVEAVRGEWQKGSIGFYEVQELKWIFGTGILGTACLYVVGYKRGSALGWLDDQVQRVIYSSCQEQWGINMALAQVQMGNPGLVLSEGTQGLSSDETTN